MKITTVKVYSVNIPFKMTFAISQRTAEFADNIIVEVQTDTRDLTGYGEGAPRSYVTGETQGSALNSVRSLCLSEVFPWNLKDVSQVWNFVDANAGEKQTHAALCALEMALLDLLGKQERCNILHYLPKAHASKEIRYGAIVPIGNRENILNICKLIKQFGVTNIRLKMGRDYNQNKEALKAYHEIIGPQPTLLVDVNMAWDTDQTLKHLPLLKSFGVKMLEQPLPPNDPGWAVVSESAKELGLALMADESVCSMEELEKAISDAYFDIVQVRLSKCGGLRLSLKTIECIRKNGLRYQIGCQLGESGVLSAAGRALCTVSSDALFFNGSYDVQLLKGNLTLEPVTFDNTGKAYPLTGPGLGVDLNPKNLSKYSDFIVHIRPPIMGKACYLSGREVTANYDLGQAT